jgi:uncharacterized OsmC-like protein
MTETKTVNGVDIGKVEDMIGQIAADTSLAAMQFRARNEWLGGGFNRTRVKDFFAAGAEDTSRTEAFELHADEPPILASGDRAPNPVEFVLHALAGCLTTTLVYHAAVRGIEIDAVDSSLEGDLDLRGLFGMSEEVRKGYHDVRVRMRVKSAASPETLAELAKFSPVYDIVSNSVPVDLAIETY